MKERKVYLTTTKTIRKRKKQLFLTCSTKKTKKCTIQNNETKISHKLKKKHKLLKVALRFKVYIESKGTLYGASCGSGPNSVFAGRRNVFPGPDQTNLFWLEPDITEISYL